MPRSVGGRPRSPVNWDAISFEASQLFTPSLPLGENELFAGRSSQIRGLLGSVSEPGKHAVLYGEQGVGKTSLAKLLSGFFPKTLRNVFHIREQADPTDDFSSIWRKVFRDIHVEVERNGRDVVAPVASFYENEITPDDVRREMLALFGPNDLPLIVIDEFDKIRSAQVRELMANTLKAMSDFGVNVTVIIVGVADDVSELILGHPSVTRCIEQVAMPRMTIAEREEILAKRIPRLGMSIGQNPAAKIVNLSRGLPAYVHSLGLESVKSALGRSSLAVEDGDVDVALSRVIARSQESIRETYYLATQSNRSDSLYGEVLLACALADSDERGMFTPLSVSDPLTFILRRERPVPIAAYQAHLKKFIAAERAKVLTRRGQERSYRFRFTDPMMQPFVIMKGIQSGLIKADFTDVMPSDVVLPSKKTET